MLAMESGRFQFSLRRMFLAIACFVGAFGTIGFLVRLAQRGMEFAGLQAAVDMTAVGLGPYLICVAFGSGVGILFGNVKTGGMMGFFLAPVLYFLFPFMYLMIF
jgi:hypothetical protein